MGLVYFLARRRILPSVTSSHHYSCCLCCCICLTLHTFGSVGSQVRPRSGTDVAEAPTGRFDCDAKRPIRGGGGWAYDRGSALVQECRSAGSYVLASSFWFAWCGLSFRPLFNNRGQVQIDKIPAKFQANANASRAGWRGFANDSRNSMGSVPILRRCSPCRIYTPAAKCEPCSCPASSSSHAQRAAHGARMELKDDDKL